MPGAVGQFVKRPARHFRRLAQDCDQVPVPAGKGGEQILAPVGLFALGPGLAGIVAAGDRHHVDRFSLLERVGDEVGAWVREMR
jgi:hypothetical protein